MYGDCVEKEYKNVYIIKIKSGEYINKKFYLYVKKYEKEKVKYGDLIQINGEYLIPSQQRNYKGFNYREYLKTKNIYGSIKTNSVKVIEENKLNDVFMISNRIRNYIIDISKELLSEDTSDLLIGILIGEKSFIPEDIIEKFKISNLSHMLSVSGAHTSYIVLGVTFLLNKSKISKRWIAILTISTLIFFMFITNFTYSVIRACLMAIAVLGGNILYRKTDIWTSMSISLLVILIFNPFAINEIGLQLSYLGTLGIVLFNKNVQILLSKIKIRNEIANLLSITISAQIMIMPIMALKFNTISLTFFISNILASPFLGINMILGFIMIFLSNISFNLAKLIAFILKFTLEILIFITNFTARIPFSNILIKTPYLFSIVIVYIFILIANYIYSIHNLKINLRLFKRNLIKNIKRNSIKKAIVYSICIIFLFETFSFFNFLIPQDLKIHFIDVGQGDSCLIITPNNKKILVDGGEQNILLSYLLDRKIKTLDYIMISHFDSDHCNGLIEVIKKLEVKNILISKQAYFCDEYKEIANIINSRKIKVTFVKEGDELHIGKNIKLNIFYPSENLEYDDLNNNSIVAKFTYNSFSILFTGDIEKTEENLIHRYKNNELESEILKIAHHGSMTSTSKAFLKAVNPKIALIGVGENNNFGHPSNIVLDRLKNINCKIYRTDQMGEIEIRIDKNGRILIMHILSK